MEEFLWQEKYRPKRVADTILPPKLKDTFQKIVDSGELPNMLFSGPAGGGKTTVARALCNEMELDYILINASESGNIDTLRNRIRQFASSVSLQGGYKVVILDEADHLNPNSFQPALRGFIEEFSRNCRFILTCNFKNRIIEPLHSRLGVIEFSSSRKELASLCGQFMKRVKVILDEENVPYQEKTIADLIMKHAPDWRRILVELQRTAMTGEITDGTITSTDSAYRDLYKHLKAKDFKKMRQWVVNNIDVDTSSIFRGLYDEMNDHVKPSSIPSLVLILAEYQYKAAFVADHELNTVACMTEIMANVEFT